MNDPITRRTVLTGAAALAVLHGLPLGAAPLAAPTPAPAAAGTAGSLRWPRYREALAIDGLGGLGNSATPEGTPLPPAALDDVRRSGLACVHLTMSPVGTTPPDAAFAQAIASIAHWERQIDRAPDVLARVRAASDIEAAKRAGRVGLVYGFQDGVMFETDLARLDTFHQLGVRVIQPTYNRRNLLGDGCMEPANAGLSRTGVEAIARMNALGILVDLSHCGRQTAADAIRASKRPVAFTHTGCDAVAAHPRHRTDGELKAVADKGGVSGIYVMPYLAGGRQPTAADVIRHLEHAIRVAGEDHVSIGTDGGVSPEVVDDAFRKRFADVTRRRREAGIAAPGETEEGYLFASDLNVPNRFELVAAHLDARGHSTTRIEKLLGLNLLRVFRETWAPAG
jgi:membrane dipeptidase